MNQDEFWRRQQQQAKADQRGLAEQRIEAQRKEGQEREQRAWDRHWDKMRNAGKEPVPAASGERTHPVVLFFGLIGALFGGVNPPWHFDWFFGAVFGFIVAGVGAGILKKTGFGRVVLLIVGLGFVALIALAIWKA